MNVVVYRATYLGITIACAIGFALNVYRDRYDLRSRRELFQTHRMFRIAGLLGSPLMTVANIDYYGVFGLIPSEVTVTFYVLGNGFVWLMIISAGYQTFVASEPFFQCVICRSNCDQ